MQKATHELLFLFFGENCSITKIYLNVLDGLHETSLSTG